MADKPQQADPMSVSFHKRRRNQWCGAEWAKKLVLWLTTFELTRNAVAIRIFRDNYVTLSVTSWSRHFLRYFHRSVFINCFFLLSAVSLLNQLWVDLCLLLSLPFLCDGRAQFPKKILLTWSKWSILAARVSATIQSLVVKPVQMYTSITDASNIIESYIMTTTSVHKSCRHYTYSICAKFCLYIHSATAFNAS